MRGEHAGDNGREGAERPQASHRQRDDRQGARNPGSVSSGDFCRRAVIWLVGRPPLTIPPTRIAVRVWVPSGSNLVLTVVHTEPLT